MPISIVIRNIQPFAKIHRRPDDMTHLLRLRRESMLLGIFLIQHQQSPIGQHNYFATYWQLVKSLGKGQIASYSRNILDKVFSGNIWQPGGMGVVGEMQVIASSQ